MTEIINFIEPNRKLLLSIIFVLLVKSEYMDRELSSLIIDRDNILMINKSNREFGTKKNS